MAERSWPWPGTTVGDAGPYSADKWDDMFEMRFGSGVVPYNNRGVIRNWANELEVTDGGANQADVDTGAALVHGKHYDNDAVVNVVVPSSSAPGNWREDLICLRSTWIDQTIRIYRHANPGENVGYPAATQTDGLCWEIPLAAVRINDVGAITQITDLREYVSTLLQPKEIQIVPQGMEAAAMPLVTDCHFGQQVALNEYAHFEFVLPSDYITTIEATLYIVAFRTAIAAVTLDIDSQGGPCDGALNAWTDTTSIAGILIPLYEIECVDVTAALDNVAMTARDLVGCRVEVTAIDAGEDILVAKLLFRYR